MYRCLVFFSVLSGLLFAQDGFRTFTNVEGRKVEARLLSVTGNECEIELRSGKSFARPVASFSLLDRAYITGFRDAMQRPATKEEAAMAEAGAPIPGAPPEGGEQAVVDEDVFEFTKVEFTQKLTRHFDIRSSNKSFEPAKEYAEEIFELLSEKIPGLVSDFEKQQFAPPDGQRNRKDFSPSDYQFRLRIYFAHTAEEWGKMIEEYAATLPSATMQKSFLTLTPRTGNFRNTTHNRFFAVYMVPGRNAASYRNLVAHMAAGMLTAGQARERGLPLWLTAGIGYYTENELFERCRVHYIDFEQYYADNQGQIAESDTLGSNAAWAKPLRSLCKKGTRFTLLDVMNAKAGDLSPALSGYTFALVSFMLSDEKRAKQFQAMLRSMRATPKTNLSEEQVFRAFGYETHEAFEKDWYEYMMSNRFK